MIHDHLGEFHEAAGNEGEGQQTHTHQERGDYFPGDVAIQDRDFGDWEPQLALAQQMIITILNVTVLFRNTLVVMSLTLSPR